MNTEVKVIVNDKEMFSIIKNQDADLLWITKSGTDKDSYIAGLTGLADACHNMTLHKIKMDSERIRNSTIPFDKG